MRALCFRRSCLLRLRLLHAREGAGHRASVRGHLGCSSDRRPRLCLRASLHESASPKFWYPACCSRLEALKARGSFPVKSGITAQLRPQASVAQRCFSSRAVAVSGGYQGSGGGRQSAPRWIVGRNFGLPRGLVSDSLPPTVRKESTIQTQHSHCRKAAEDLRSLCGQGVRTGLPKAPGLPMSRTAYLPHDR